MRRVTLTLIGYGHDDRWNRRKRRWWVVHVTRWVMRGWGEAKGEIVYGSYRLQVGRRRHGASRDPHVVPDLNTSTRAVSVSASPADTDAHTLVKFDKDDRRQTPGLFMGTVSRRAIYLYRTT